MSVDVTRVFDAPKNLAEAALLRQQAPIVRVNAPSGGEVWMIVSHELARATLADPRVGRSPLVVSGSVPYRAKFPEYLTRTLLFTDGADHMRLRRAVARWFAPRTINLMRDAVTAECERLLDVMTAQGEPGDLIQSYAVPVPIFALTHILGADRSMADEFLRWNRVLFGTSEEALAQMPAIEAECREYMRSAIRAKRARPGDDLLSALAATSAEDGALSEEEIVSLATLILVAGFDNTANFIGTGAMALMWHPEQRDFLLEDIDGRIATVVEELLRHGRQSVGSGVGNLGMPFAALEDVELGGILIRKNEPILINRNAANHDESVFADPLELDVSREVNPHLTLSYGSHSCLGAPLARLELQAATSCLFRRLPQLRIAGEPEYQSQTMSEAIEKLPVAWTTHD